MNEKMGTGGGFLNFLIKKSWLKLRHKGKGRHRGKVRQGFPKAWQFFPKSNLFPKSAWRHAFLRLEKAGKGLHDVAHFMLKPLNTDLYLRKAPGLSY